MTVFAMETTVLSAVSQQPVSKQPVVAVVKDS